MDEAIEKVQRPSQFSTMHNTPEDFIIHSADPRPLQTKDFQYFERIRQGSEWNRLSISDDEIKIHGNSLRLKKDKGAIGQPRCQDICPCQLLGQNHRAAPKESKREK